MTHDIWKKDCFNDLALSISVRVRVKYVKGKLRLSFDRQRFCEE